MAASALGRPLETDPPRPPKHCGEHSLTCGRDGCRESAVGSSSNLWRIAQSGHRDLGANGVPTAPATTGSSTLSDLANVPGQSHRKPGFHGLLHGLDPHRARAVRLRAPCASTPTNRSLCDHRPSDGRVDGAADHRGFSGGHRAAMAIAGSRCHLRGCVPAPCRGHGHHGGHHRSIKSLAKSVRGATDRIPTSGVSRSRHRPRPGASAAHDRSGCFLLSWGQNSSLPREGRTRATSRPSANGRSRRGVRGSRWPTPSVRATRSLTRPVRPAWL